MHLNVSLYRVIRIWLMSRYLKW